MRAKKLKKDLIIVGIIIAFMLVMWLFAKTGININVSSKSSSDFERKISESIFNLSSEQYLTDVKVINADTKGIIKVSSDISEYYIKLLNIDITDANRLSEVLQVGQTLYLFSDKEISENIDGYGTVQLQYAFTSAPSLGELQDKTIDKSTLLNQVLIDKGIAIANNSGVSDYFEF